VSNSFAVEILHDSCNFCHIESDVFECEVFFVRD
jgi:hypothetical protein